MTMPLSGQPTPATLESVGLTAGSRFIATPDEAAEQEAEERRRLDAANAHIDRVIASVQHPRTAAERLDLLEAAVAEVTNRLDALEARRPARAG